MAGHPRKAPRWCWSLILLVAVCCAQAIINPALQPRDLFERYEVVVKLSAASFDEANHRAVLNYESRIEPRSVQKANSYQ